MKNLRQLLQRAGLFKSKKRRSRSRSTQERRQLISQTLEKREMLAGDGLNPNHNYWHALDATNDQVLSARDALVIMNHQIKAAALGEEIPAEDGMLLDTNNSGTVTSADALAVMNGLQKGEEVGELVELLLTARDANDNLLPEDGNGAINVDVNEIFKLEISYDDLRTFGGNIGAFQVFADIVASQPTLRPVLNETQRLVFDEGVRSALTGSYLFSLEGSTATYTSTLNAFGTDPAAEIANALTAFGYSPSQYVLTKLETGDDNIRYQIRYTDPAFGNIDLPDISVADNFDVNADVTFSEFAPFLPDGVTPNSAAVRFNLETHSRTFKNNSEFYNSLNTGAFDAVTGFDEIGGVGGVPTNGGGIPELAAPDQFIEPFDVLSVCVFFTAPAQGVDVSVNPGEGAEALLLYGRNEPVPQDLILIDEDAVLTFNAIGAAEDIFDPVFDADDYPANVAENIDDTVVIATVSATDADAGDAVFYSITGADPVYALATQSTTLDLDLGGDAVIGNSFSFTDSQAEVHGLPTSDPASVPLDVPQAAVEFVPGAPGVHGAAPGENTYFRAGNTSAGNWNPGGAGGAVNPGGNLARADALITAAVGIEADILAGTLVAENISESIVNSVYQTVEDAGGIGNWELSYQITTGGAGNATFELTADFVNELIADAAGAFIGPPEGDFAEAEVTFVASLFDNTGNSAVDINGADPGTSWTPAEGNILISQFGPGRTVSGPTVQASALTNGGAGAVALAANSIFTLSIAGTEISQVVPNSDSDLFEIDSRTGAVSLAAGRSLDAETDTSHMLTVTASESFGSGTDTATVTITVTDVDEFDVGDVTDSNGNLNVIAEDATAGTLVQITASASDADLTNNTITYSLAPGTLDNDLFAINPSSGVVTLKTTGSLNAETASSHTIQVTATSSDTSSSNATFTINVIDVNEFSVGAVTDNNGNANTIAENATAGTPVQITALATDPDVSSNVTYSLAASTLDNDLFVIDSASGVVTLKTSGSLSGQANSSKTIEVTATSSDTSSNTAQFPIAVTELDEFDVGPVTDVDNDPNSIAETATAGTLVQITAFAEDMDASNNTITYSLAAGVSDNDLFQIDSSSGVVSLKTSGTLDAETSASHTIEVTATSSDTSSNTAQFTINVTDVDEFDVGAVTDSNANANTIAENATAGTLVKITASAADADATNNTITYSLAASTLDNDLFVIDSASGVVTLKTSGSLSGQANSSKTIEVTATSSDTSSNTAQFPIDVTGVDEFDVGPVTDSNTADNEIAENATAGTLVQITAFAEDLDASNNTITYSLAAGVSDNDLFQIDSSSGVVSLKTSGSLDAETSTSHTIEVTATSSDSSSNTAQFTITVTDVNEFPLGAVTDADTDPNEIAENATAGTPLQITLFATDNDVSDTVTYSGGSSLFEVDPSSGVVTLKTTGSLIGAAGETRTTTFLATSTDGSSRSFNTTFTITESSDPPTNVTGTLFIDERGSSGDRNGTMDDGESGLSGIKVHLRSLAANNNTGQDINLIALTDAHGTYLFTGVPPGTFEVEYEIPDDVVFVGSNVTTLVLDGSGGTTTPPTTFSALGTSGNLANFDIIASSYLRNNEPLNAATNGGVEGGQVSLNSNGGQRLIILGEGFDVPGVDFVEFTLNSQKDAGLLTIVQNGVARTAQVGEDNFVVSQDGLSVRFFGGIDDFVFVDSIDELVQLDFPAFRDSVDIILGNGN